MNTVLVPNGGVLTQLKGMQPNTLPHFLFYVMKHRFSS